MARHVEVDGVVLPEICLGSPNEFYVWAETARKYWDSSTSLVAMCPSLCVCIRELVYGEFPISVPSSMCLAFSFSRSLSKGGAVQCWCGELVQHFVFLIDKTRLFSYMDNIDSAVEGIVPDEACPYILFKMEAEWASWRQPAIARCYREAPFPTPWT